MVGQREILVFIAQKLNEFRIPYLLTGSFAVSYFGYPRATHDIDFVIEILPDASPLVLAFMKDLKKTFAVDINQVSDELIKKGMIDIFDPESGVKVDFWIVKNDFDKTKFKRAIKIEINNQKINLVSAEDLILTKLLWCKKIRSERHIRDCAGIWKIQKGKLDEKYLNNLAETLNVKILLDEIKVMDY